MSDFMTTLFGPLNKDACIYFLFISGLFYFVFILIIIASIIYLMRNPKEFKLSNLTVGNISLLLNCFILYFVNRLLYTMCVKSLI